MKTVDTSDIFLSPTSMSGGNTVSDPHGHELAMSSPGSESVNPIPDRLDNVGQPKLPGAQMPVSTQPGHWGGKGLPSPPSNQAASVRPAGPQPGRDGGWTTGNQPGGNQGSGYPGAGDSGQGAKWGPTPSFSTPDWGESNTDA